MSDDQERCELEAVYGGWRDARTLEDVEEQERFVDRYAERKVGMVDQSDVAIAREMLTGWCAGPSSVTASTRARKPVRRS